MKPIAQNETLLRTLTHFGFSSLVMNAARQPLEIPNVGRVQLAQLFHALGFTVGAEIGVEEGKYAEVLCRENPGVHLYAVDAWEAYTGYREHVTQGVVDALMELATDRLAPYHCTLVRKRSVEAAQDFADGSLDFVYIDANHEFSYIAADLAAWVPKVRKGGIVSGHDFIKRTKGSKARTTGYRCHVVEVVTAYTQAYHIAPWFVLGSKGIVNGETRDRPRSYFWVKA